MGATPKPVVLCILDGWGLRDEAEGNAVAQAATPVYDRLRAEAPMATLKTCGEDVGLPHGQMGNSEVGHTNIGAGRVVWMDLPKIDKAIAQGAYATRENMAEFIAKVKKSDGFAHVMGLMSPGGVHAHQDHIIETARALAEAGVPVRLHLFLDGRDTPPKSALEYLESFQSGINELPGVSVASVTGRFYAMDRDNRWERVSRAFEAIVEGRGHKAPTARAAIEAAYERGETDEFVEPTVIGHYAGVLDGDGMFMANFRADRAREILSCLLDPAFEEFERPRTPRFCAALGMVEYSTAHNSLMQAVFPQEEIADTLGAWAASKGKTQLRLAETEKYPHVTFFLNGGEEEPNEGEDRHMAPSPKVATYDLAPEMSAAEVTEVLVKGVRSQKYDLIVVNFANPDMVGHTGDVEAAKRAVEICDKGVGEAWAALEEVGGAMLVTADHGNCEMMVDPNTGGPHTAHTLNEVPIFLVGGGGRTLAQGGRLADVAPSLLELMELEQPAAMTGRSLIQPAKG